MAFIFALSLQSNVIPPQKGIVAGRKLGAPCHILETIVYPLSFSKKKNKRKQESLIVVVHSVYPKTPQTS